MFYKTLHRKLKIEKYEPTKKDTKTGGESSSCSTKGTHRVVLVN